MPALLCSANEGTQEARETELAASHTPPELGPERALAARLGLRRIAGIDEAGRGPWAGPVVAAACVLDPDRLPDGIRDSKMLSPARRREIAAALADCAEIGLGLSTVEEIDRLNIGRATELAMCRALTALEIPAEGALIDGNRLPADLRLPGATLIGGDRLSLSIAAASIAAKVARDAMMAELARAHPGYGWERNAGYGTPEHRAALARLGVTPAHRRSFRPIHNILCQKRPANC